jgi:hypothetical protein
VAPLNLDLREQAIVDGARIEALQRQIEDRIEVPPIWRWKDFELRRLHAVVSRQAHEIAQLRAELHELQEAMRLVDVEDLTEAVLGALERGSDALIGLEVVEASAELKVVLEIARGRPGLVVGPAGPVDPRVLSTIRLELRRRD